MTEGKPIISDRELIMEFEAHELCLRTDGRQGWRADLQGERLVGKNFTHAKLPISIRSCASFRHAQFSADALPWLVLHPGWSEMKGTVQIIDG